MFVGRMSSQVFRVRNAHPQQTDDLEREGGFVFFFFGGTFFIISMHKLSDIALSSLLHERENFTTGLGQWRLL